MPRNADLIAIGRSSVDLYGQQLYGRLEDMVSFAKFLGGSPTNTAVGAARLGMNAGLVTRVGADHMGRFVREQLVREGVDVQGIVTDPERLTALVLLGVRDPQTFPLLFYRENCADMAVCVADLDRAWIGSAGAVLINGTHLSQPGVFAASVDAARCCKQGGGRVIFDVDYRPVLWGLTARDMGEQRFVEHSAVSARMQQVLPLCDLVVGTEEEIHVLGDSVDTLAALRAIRALTQAVLVCKRGAAGCVVFPGSIPHDVEAGLVVPGFQVEVYNVLGAGDAFMAGFLRGWLRDEPLARCCEWGNACGAIVVSRHGCAPAMPTWPELQQFLAATQRPFRLRDDTELEHVHWATTRVASHHELLVLAIDHRAQFEELAHSLGVDQDRISAFKALAVRAIEIVASGGPGFGLLLDGRYGQQALSGLADGRFWIGRPIERPKSRPLEFEATADVATELASWPGHQVVKCLVLYHPDDEPVLRERQERQLLRLFDACRKTSHELLIEVILPRHMASTATTAASALSRLYAIGVRPDWWKLEPAADPDTWRHVQAAVDKGDVYCRGVLLLGSAASEEELVAAFAAAAPCPVVKGFAVGRTIFAQVAHDWMSGRIADGEAVALLAGRFGNLVTAWREARRMLESGR